MPTKSSVAKRVARGAKLLDELEPGWHRKIRVEELKLASCVECVCGQLAFETANRVVKDEVYDSPFNAYHAFRNFLGRKLARRGRKIEADALVSGPWRFGFNTKETDEEYSELDQLWTRQIAKRLKADVRS